jgi:glycosyltransferase involved in cell wall biosynthesis
MKSAFFVPVFNQAEELPDVIEMLQETDLPCDTILIVNNGSTDGSAAIVENSGFDFIHLPENKGVGYSFMVAIAWALENGFEVLGTLAGNGKMLPAEMHRVLNPVLENKADYVTGSRFLPGGQSPNLPTFRRVMIPMISWMVNLLCGVRLTDATCGYRAFRTDIIRKSSFDWQHSWLNTYGLEYYLYGKVLLNRDIRWLEVPITMRYPTKGKRYTKMKPFVSWYQMIKPWLVARFDGATVGI